MKGLHIKMHQPLKVAEESGDIFINAAYAKHGICQPLAADHWYADALGEWPGAVVAPTPDGTSPENIRRASDDAAEDRPGSDEHAAGHKSQTRRELAKMWPEPAEFIRW